MKMSTLFQDIRYALRQLRKSPGFTLTAVITLALGIGANTAMFTVIRSVLLKPLPFSEPDRLVRVYESSADNKFPFNISAGGVYTEWRKQSRSFSDLALYKDSRFNLAGSDGQIPEMAHGAACTWNLMSTLGVQPALGRNLTANEDQRSANRTVLLSWSSVAAAVWRRSCDCEPNCPAQYDVLHGGRCDAAVVCLSQCANATVDSDLPLYARSIYEFSRRS